MSGNFKDIVTVFFFPEHFKNQKKINSSYFLKILKFDTQLKNRFFYKLLNQYVFVCWCIVWMLSVCYCRYQTRGWKNIEILKFTYFSEKPRICPIKDLQNYHNHRADFLHAIFYAFSTLEENWARPKRSSNFLRHQVWRSKIQEFVSKSGVRN